MEVSSFKHKNKNIKLYSNARKNKLKPSKKKNNIYTIDYIVLIGI